jgi:hypothetical protein
MVQRGVGLDEARRVILDKVADASEQTRTFPHVSTPLGGRDERVTRRDAVTNALLHRYSPTMFTLSDPAREYRGMTLLELAREFLASSGVNVRGMSRDEIATRSLHSTSDFPEVLSAVTNKTLRQAYDIYPRTFVPFCRQVLATDFKAMNRVQIGEAPQLLKVSEGGEFKRGSITALITLPIAVATYLVTWTGWFATSGGYYRNLAPSQIGLPQWLGWIAQPIQAFWHYQTQIYNFHVNLHTPHGYASSPLTWLLPIRPTAFYFEGSDAGTAACQAATNCVNAITALGNPLIWLAAVVALVFVATRWIRKRNQLSLLILLGIVAGYAPWLLFLNRTTFQFYAIVFLPWMLLALGYWLKIWVSQAQPEAKVRGRAVVFAFLALSLVFSIFFSNIWLGYTTPYWYWHIHMWLPSWI